MRRRTRRVTNWKDGSMVLRWAASALMATEKRFRRIMGHQQLWMLDSHMKEPKDTGAIDSQKKAG